MWSQIIQQSIISESATKLNLISKNMHGKTFHHHYHIIYDIISLIDKPEITYTEIGTYYGGSVCLVLSHDTDKKLNIYCIDTLTAATDLKQKLTENINKYNHKQRRVNLIQGDSRDSRLHNMLGRNDFVTDILFIDGDHTYQGPISDFINFMPFMNEGSYIIFDDYNDSQYSPEVKKAVDFIVSKIKNREIFGLYEILGDHINLFAVYPESLPRYNEYILIRSVIPRTVKFAIVAATYHRSSGNTKSYLTQLRKMLELQTYQEYKLYLMGDDYEDFNELLDIFNGFDSNKIYIQNVVPARERSRCKIRHNLWSIGGANAMNNGIRKAREEGICTHYVHLDDDDKWHPNHLLTLATAYCQYPEVDAVWTQGVMKGNVLPKVSHYGINNFIPRGSDAYHSCFSHDFSKIDLYYTTLGDDEEENGRMFEAADCDMIKRIGKMVDSGVIKSMAVPFVTVYHDQEGTLS